MILNVDIGEGLPWDRDLLRYATAANVGCGEHAGSFRNTRSISELVLANGVALGAHPGYPDRTSIGRQSPPAGSKIEWMESVFRQLDQMVNALPIRYVKFHGALYHDWLDYEAMEPWSGKLVEWLLDTGVGVLGLRGTGHEKLAAYAEVEFFAEGFAERGYLPNGTLIPRGDVGAELTDVHEICAQAVRLAHAGVDSICIHGDREDCVALAQEVRNALLTEGFIK